MNVISPGAPGECAAWFRAIFDDGSVPTVIASVDGHVQRVNGAFTALLGYSQDDVRGRPIEDFTHPDDRVLTRERTGQIGEGAGTSERYEKRYVRRDGGVVHALVTVNTAEINGTRHLVGQIVDLTRQRASAEAQRLLAAIVTCSRDAILGFSLDGRITSWNAAAEVMTGFTAAEMLGAPAHRPVVPERRCELAPFIASVAAGEELGAFETVIERKDGSRFEGEVTMSPVRGVDGAIVGMAVIGRDISDRKLVERKLLESQQRFDEIAGTIDEVFWAADPQMSRIHYISPGYEALTGRSALKLYADPKSFVELIVPEDRAAVMAQIARLPQGQRLEAEYRIVRDTDGAVRWIWNRAFPVRDAAGQLTHVVGVATDITDRKRQEQALARVNRALKALSRANGALVRAKGEQELYTEMARAIVESAGYRMAWVGLVEHDADASLRRVAFAGEGSGYLDAGRVTWADNERGQSLCGRAVRAGVPIASRKIDRDLSLGQWWEHALSAGFRSGVALPLRDGDDVFGVLGIYSSEVDAFGADEMALLTEMASDLSFGIVTLRMRANHERNIVRLERSMEATVRALASTVEMRDPYTAGHQSRVAEIAVRLGRELGLAEDRLRGLHLAATIHDIGKLCIPAEILSKPGRLTPAEFELMKSHPESGAKILEGIEFPWPIREMVWQHHERLDGAGYPRGLKGEEILLEARILTVADVFEAMSSHRPYRPALGIDAALELIARGRGTQFDPAVADACLRLYGKRVDVTIPAPNRSFLRPCAASSAPSPTATSSPS